MFFSSMVSELIESFVTPSVDSPAFLGAGFLFGLRKLCAWAKTSALCFACCALKTADPAAPEFAVLLKVAELLLVTVVVDGVCAC